MKKRARIFLTLFLFAAILGAVFLFLPIQSSAQTIEELRKIVHQKNEEIKKLEEEAEQYRSEIASTQSRGRTLQEEISRINRAIEQLRREIILTEQRISRTEVEIEVLDLEIGKKEDSIERSRKALGSIIQSLFERGSRPAIAVFIKFPRLSDFFRQMGYAMIVQQKLVDTLELLHASQKELGEKKGAAEEKRIELIALNSELTGKRNLQEEERRERNRILTQTRNQERLYQQLLADQERKSEELEKEIREIEQKIRIIIDPQSLPPKGRGVIGLPLSPTSLVPCRYRADDPPHCITQFFGYTSFAASGAYGGHGHNGTDFRASVGTPVFAVEGGIVEGIGDTDASCRRASYGKWILIRHHNNLSSLYAHLGRIDVTAGQEVRRGQRIGLSGNSGYSTGPHLHLSLFAAQGVSIESIRSRVCGTFMTLPIAPMNAYLDPLDYM